MNLSAHPSGDESLVIIIDDDISVRESMGGLFDSVGLRSRLFASAPDMLQCALPDVPSCLVLDVRMPGFSGLDLQAQLNAAKVHLPIIFITGYGDVAMTVRAMKAGAVDVLTKPFRDQDLLDAVASAIDVDRKHRAFIHRRPAWLEQHLFPPVNNEECSMKQLTTVAGAPVVDNNNTQTAGPRGPALLQDVWLLEKLAHFDREVIPERRMHAKGSGAFGRFTVTHDITRYTKARLFAEIGKHTEVFVRFSTVAGERGAADAERDIRGFAIKFYTEQGNWDLVGNNTPVFFLRDPLKFPDLNHAVKRDPRTNLRSANNNWDFWTLLPEALHQVTIVMSDRGLPQSYRHMHGFGSHTFSFISPQNERSWVKFTWKTEQGIANLTDAQASALVGDDRESAQRDLYSSIEAGDFPRWKLFVQIMPEQDAGTYSINPFDLTKVWPHADYPLIEVGELELNRNPSNYFAEVEQAAFNPANVVPGISFSPDKMLQARLFSYGDAQRYRVGVNHHQIPVNAPRCPVNSYHRDGQMRTDSNAGSTLGYEPNSYGEWAEQPDFSEPPLALHGAAGHWNHREDADYFSQPGALFRLMNPDQQQALFDNTARSIHGASAEIKQRHIQHCTLADPQYGAGVALAIEQLG